MFGMVQHGARGIEGFIGTPQEEDVGDVAQYGIDWEALNDPTVISHHNAHNPDARDTRNSPFAPFQTPERLSQVDVEPPNCPLSDMQLRQLDAYLESHFDVNSREMLVRRSIWTAAIEMCIEMTSM